MWIDLPSFSLCWTESSVQIERVSWVEKKKEECMVWKNIRNADENQKKLIRFEQFLESKTIVDCLRVITWVSGTHTERKWRDHNKRSNNSIQCFNFDWKRCEIGLNKWTWTSLTFSSLFFWLFSISLWACVRVCACSPHLTTIT